MIRIFGLLALLLLPVQALAQDAPRWEMIPSESTLSFMGKQMGAEFTGVFEEFSADIRFDPENLAASKAAVEVDIASVETKDDERDTNIRGKEWFDAEKFPTARFETTSFRKTGDDSFEAEANLTIHGTTLPVLFPFTLSFVKDDSGKEKAVMKGSVVIDRSKFGLGTGDWEDPSIIANDVAVEAFVTAQRVQ